MKMTTHKGSKAVLALALVAGLGLASSALHAAQVSIAVAANFTDATRDLIPLFEQATGHSVKVSFGSTGKLYAQIQNGAPFALFLAADSLRPQKAEAEGLAVDGTRFTYAVGKLALWSPRPGVFGDAEAYLKQGDFAHLAIANPKTAPYGLAAQQVLTRLGVWEALQGRVVRGDSIAQTFQFTATGNADAGFVALSQVRAWKDSEATLWEVPQAYYAPIEQQAVLLERGERNPAARELLEFLKSDAARAVITGYGYGVK